MKTSIHPIYDDKYNEVYNLSILVLFTITGTRKDDQVTRQVNYPGVSYLPVYVHLTDN